MTLDEVKFFVSKNQGRKLSTYGGQKKFSIEFSKNGLRFVLEGEGRDDKTVSFAQIEKGLKIYNSNPSVNTTEYLKYTKGGTASYELGLFRQIKEDQKCQANIESTLIPDIDEIRLNKNVDPTTKQALVDARIGQGKFGSKVREFWNDHCAVTGSSTRAVLEASHIKCWADSNDAERLDSNNGLLLTANLHKLFDAGLISFDDSGKMLVSSKLSQSEQEIFGVVGKKLSKKPPAETANYLAHHRANFLE
jgi:predicted restriction endonuclease